LINARPNEPFFSFSADINPLDQRADNAIKLKLLPLEIVVNPLMLESIFSFFSRPTSEALSLHTIQAYAQERISSIAQQTKAGLDYAIEHHKTLDLVVDISAPIFIFPER
jgi:vacuolar protein sorting-associated protein 13A/C